MLNLTDYLATLGAITGVSALLLNYRTYRESLPRYKILFPCNDNGEYFTVNQYADSFTDEGRIIFYIRIENHSSRPVTVTQYNLSIPEYSLNDVISDSLTKAAQTYSPTNVDEHINIGDFQLLTPFKIDSYDAIQGYIFFPVPRINLTESTKCHLRIFTTRELISTTINLVPSAIR